MLQIFIQGQIFYLKYWPTNHELYAKWFVELNDLKVVHGEQKIFTDSLLLTHWRILQFWTKPLKYINVQ